MHGHYVVEQHQDRRRRAVLDLLEPQNSIRTAPTHGVGRPFPKGVSGNPGGRPKGLVRRIREETNDGEEVVDYTLGVFRDPAVPPRDRTAAATWLSDRGFGRPTQTALSTPVPRVSSREELAALTDDELELIARGG
jgi:hypothetical protein